jgi:hypothetical protein
LESLIIPHTVTTVGESAFSRCDGLKSLTISNGVATIGQGAFAGCKKLTSVMIPDSVVSIDGAAFAGCCGLMSVHVGRDNPNYSSVDGILFSKSGDTLVLYPGARQSTYAIPDGVATVGPAAFKAIAALTSVTIPNSVTIIGQSAFSGCAGLTSLIVNNPKPPKIRHDPFSGIKWDKICLYVPEESIDAYHVADWWRLFKHIKPLSAVPSADSIDYFPVSPSAVQQIPLMGGEKMEFEENNEYQLFNVLGNTEADIITFEKR